MAISTRIKNVYSLLITFLYCVTYITVLARTVTFETTAIHLCMHSTLMVVVVKSEIPIYILKQWKFLETLINTNLVAPAAVSGTQIQSNSSSDCYFHSSGRSDSATF